MTELKMLTPQEALRALADGKKLTAIGCQSYIWLDCGVIVWDHGRAYTGGFNKLSLYTEPKPKVVLVEYCCVNTTPEFTTTGHSTWLPEGIEPQKSPSWTYHPTGRKIEV